MSDPAIIDKMPPAFQGSSAMRLLRLLTRALKRAECVPAIGTRGQQFTNNRKAFREWHQAFNAADRIWLKHLSSDFVQYPDAILASNSHSPHTTEGTN